VDFYPNVLHWPRLLQRDRTWGWNLAARSLSGGRSISGVLTGGRLDGGGLLLAQLGDIQVSSEDQVRAFRALAGVLDNGVTPVCLEARDERHAAWPIVNGRRFSTQYTSQNGDGSTSSDGAVYVSDVISAQLRIAADLRATTLELAVENASALRGGEYLSIQHDTFSHRLYENAGVEGIDGRPHAARAVEIGIGIGAPFVAPAHGLVANQTVFLRTSGALPVGLAPDTAYWVVGLTLTANTFQLAATPGGGAINTAAPQSGTHRFITGGLPRIKIRPPLREATSAGTRVEFDFPKCIMRLARPDAMNLALERRIHGEASVPFVESLLPPFDLED
jgi:hypothetical protein